MILFIEIIAVLVVISIILWFFGVDEILLLAWWLTGAIIFCGFTGLVAWASWMIRNWFPICGC